MNLKEMSNKERITDDKKCVNLLKQLFPVADSSDDLDLVLEMGVFKITPEDVVIKFDNEFIPKLEQGEELRKGFLEFLAEYSNAPESLDTTLHEYCINSNISFDTAVDALNQWLPTQLKYELTECF